MAPAVYATFALLIDRSPAACRAWAVQSHPRPAAAASVCLRTNCARSTAHG